MARAIKVPKAFRPPYKNLTPEQVWLVYHLMRGGYDDRDMLRYMAAIPEKYFTHIDLDALYLWCDDNWLKFLRAARANLGLDPSCELPRGPLLCKGCLNAVTHVPCGICMARGVSPDWVTNRHKVVRWTPKPVDRISGAEMAIARSIFQYHGYAEEDV